MDDAGRRLYAVRCPAWRGNLGGTSVMRLSPPRKSRIHWENILPGGGGFKAEIALRRPSLTAVELLGIVICLRLLVFPHPLRHFLRRVDVCRKISSPGRVKEFGEHGKGPIFFKELLPNEPGTQRFYKVPEEYFPLRRLGTGTKLIPSSGVVSGPLSARTEEVSHRSVMAPRWMP